MGTEEATFFSAIPIGTIIDSLGQPGGTFASNHANTTYALPTAWSVAGSGDFNGDGQRPAAAQHRWQPHGMARQANGSFNWNSSATYGVDPGWTVAATGSFNGDGGMTFFSAIPMGLSLIG